MTVSERGDVRTLSEPAPLVPLMDCGNTVAAIPANNRSRVFVRRRMPGMNL